MKTSLIDSHNNKKVIPNKDGNVQLSEIRDSIRFRISKHYEFIKRDRSIIENNVDFTNIITDAVERINERSVKIRELRELLDYSLNLD